MIKIRLARKGAKNNPVYRIVAIEKTKKRDGKPLEILGYWYPKKDEKEIDEKKLKEWIDKGAKTTPAVDKLLGKMDKDGKTS